MSQLSSNDKVIIFQCFEHQKGIGDYLANYFIHASCAWKTGAHFLAPVVMDIEQEEVNEIEESLHTHHHQGHNKQLDEAAYTLASYQTQQSFLKMLPTYFIHPHPKPIAEHLSLKKEFCRCDTLVSCLQNQTSSFALERDWIVEQIRSLVSNFHSHAQQKSLNETMVNPLYDDINVPLAYLHSAHVHPDHAADSRERKKSRFGFTLLPDDSSVGGAISEEDKVRLPLVPDVVVYYHCNDELDGQFSGGNPAAGSLLSFQSLLRQLQTFLKGKELAGRKRRFFYVLTEPGRHIPIPADYRSPPPLQNQFLQCSMVLQWLGTFLHEKLNEGNEGNDTPQNVVMVKRNSNFLLDYQRLAQAPLVVSSLSAFSFFPLLANSLGDVFFPSAPDQAGLIAFLSRQRNVQFLPDAKMIAKSPAPSPWRLFYFHLVEQAGNIDLAHCDGLVVQGGTRSVYLVKDGQRHEFLSGGDFETLGYSWHEVMKISPALLNSIPVGAPVSV